MPVGPEEFSARVAASAAGDGRLPLPDTSMAGWETFPFEPDGLLVRRLQQASLPEAPRFDEDPATCHACQRADEALWQHERWGFVALESGAPLVLMLQPRAHHDLPDLPDDVAAELGVVASRVASGLRVGCSATASDRSRHENSSSCGSKRSSGCCQRPAETPERGPPIVALAGAGSVWGCSGGGVVGEVVDACAGNGCGAVLHVGANTRPSRSPIAFRSCAMSSAGSRSRYGRPVSLRAGPTRWNRATLALELVAVLHIGQKGPPHAHAHLHRLPLPRWRR